MDILILLGSHSDLPITEKGVAILKEFGVSFQLRIASAHRTPDHVESLIAEFESQQGKVIMCVAGMSAHLAGVVAAKTLKPIIAIPVQSSATAGFDALLSMVQMPGGIPVATMGFGSSGFLNGSLLASEIIALGSDSLKAKLIQHRKDMVAKVMEADSKHHIKFPL